MNKKLRKNSFTTNSSESITSIDSRSYSTDKSRSNSIEFSIETNIENFTSIDLSNNKNNWVIPIAKKEPKRRKRDMHINNENISTTPVINYDYLNFQHFTVLESTNK
jgi:hypothetical protein